MNGAEGIASGFVVTGGDGAALLELGEDIHWVGTPPETRT